jgi:hypothetical protein
MVSGPVTLPSPTSAVSMISCRLTAQEMAWRTLRLSIGGRDGLSCSTL